MSLLCRLGFHRWRDESYDYLNEYVCARCGKHHPEY